MTFDNSIWIEFWANLGNFGGMALVVHDFQGKYPSQLLDALAPDSYRGP